MARRLSVHSRDSVMHLLTPLMPWIHNESVSDLVCNGRGEWFVDHKGHWEAIDVGVCDDQWVRRFVALLAHRHRIRVSESSPFLSATLSIGARVQCVLPPVTTHPTVSIRLFRPGLSWKKLQVSSSNRQTDKASVCQHHLPVDDLSPWGIQLQQAMQEKKTILIAGATSSGKTTLLRGLLSLCDPMERLLVLEDSPELQLPDSHAVMLRAQGEASVTGYVSLMDLLRVSLRLRPDRIILGEIRGEEGYDFLSACQTGHVGLLATIHAGSAQEARHRLAQLCLSHPRCDVPLPVLTEWIASSIPVIAQCSREHGAFRVEVEEGR